MSYKVELIKFPDIHRHKIIRYHEFLDGNKNAIISNLTDAVDYDDDGNTTIVDAEIYSPTDLEMIDVFRQLHVYFKDNKQYFGFMDGNMHKGWGYCINQHDNNTILRLDLKIHTLFSCVISGDPLHISHYFNVTEIGKINDKTFTNSEV